MEPELPPAIGIIGGSGLYQMEALTVVREIAAETPFGPPSDVIFAGRLAERDVYFLPRHARGHRLLPTEINHRANIYALRALGVRWLISVGAVGSLQEQYAPRHIVLPDQFFDRTSRREHHTFFGQGIVAHVGFADPTSARLRRLLYQAAIELGLTVHNGGTYVNMDGPAFSTRAESEANRQLGFDVIGMTNLPEAKLAREAEMAMEDRGRAGQRGNGDRASAGERRHGQANAGAGDPAVAGGGGLAGASGAGHRDCDVARLVAAGHVPEAAGDFGAV
jgi:5'-methylthioadenosine phosphorylase